MAQYARILNIKLGARTNMAYGMPEEKDVDPKDLKPSGIKCSVCGREMKKHVNGFLFGEGWSAFRRMIDPKANSKEDHWFCRFCTVLAAKAIGDWCRSLRDRGVNKPEAPQVPYPADVDLIAGDE